MRTGCPGSVFLVVLSPARKEGHVWNVAEGGSWPRDEAPAALGVWACRQRRRHSGGGPLSQPAVSGRPEPGALAAVQVPRG